MNRHARGGLTESTRRALEEAAYALSARDGFDRTTAAAIAAEAGFTERTFFRYFDEKEDVVFSPLESGFDAHLPNLRQRVLQEGLTVDSVLNAFSDTDDQHPDRVEVILRFFELIRDNPSLERRLAFHRQWFAERVTEAVADVLGQDEPDLSVRVTVAVAIAVNVAATELWRAHGGQVAFDDLLDEARRLIAC